MEPNQEKDSGSSPWRLVLTIVLAVIALVRLAVTCSKDNSRSVTYDQGTTDIYESQQQLRSLVTQAQYAKARTILYHPQTFLDSLSPLQLRASGLTRPVSDSAIAFDLSSNLMIPKDSYFQNVHDPARRFGFRLPEHIIVCIDEYYGKDGIASNLKTSKKEFQLENLVFDTIKKSGRKFFYDFTYEGRTFHGFGMVLENQGHMTLYTFESEQMKSLELLLKSVEFMKKSIKMIPTAN